MWEFLVRTVSSWLRFYGYWVETQYNSFGPRMYGYLLAIVLVFGIYLLKPGTRKS